MDSVSNSNYNSRKRFLPQYRQLFKVLLDIPDENVRNRVTDAINGVTMCPVCKSKNTREFGTQTESDTDTAPERNGDTTIVLEDKSKQTSKKKSRKRNRPCPRVCKNAQLSSTVPVLKQNPNIPALEEVPPKKVRTEEEDIPYWNFSPVPDTDSQNMERIQEQMRTEFRTCLNYVDGLLPIHHAIMENDLVKLRRQIYVFSFLKKNLMELLTDDNCNVIQLAVLHNCYNYIIEELLNHESIHLQDVDADQNTIIHLAVLHLSCDDNIKQQKPMLKCFQLLLRKFDLKMLLEKNDEGLTALHIAVRENKYLMVETMLNVIDDMLHIKTVDPINASNPTPKDFVKHYNKQCDHFEGRTLHKLKIDILNATDMKSGCTALYFAMVNKYDHIIYLLLAHMSDPRVKNLAGIDPMTYYTTHSRNAVIAGTIDKLNEFLQNKTNL